MKEYIITNETGKQLRFSGDDIYHVEAHTTTPSIYVLLELKKWEWDTNGTVFHAWNNCPVLPQMLAFWYTPLRLVLYYCVERDKDFVPSKYQTPNGDTLLVEQVWKPAVYALRREAKPVEAIKLSEDTLPHVRAFVEQCTLFQSPIRSCEAVNNGKESYVAIIPFSGIKQVATCGDYIVRVDGMLRVFDGPLFETLFKRKEAT